MVKWQCVLRVGSSRSEIIYDSIARKSLTTNGLKKIATVVY